MKTEMIHTRINQNLKREAELVFGSLGINTADAIRMFLTQVTLNQGIPFDIKIPNIETRNAIKDSRKRKNLSTISMDDLDKVYDA
jgi:DNA-damage-inducible protein J